MNFLKIILPVLFISLSFTTTYSQFSLRKANKQYELYAFNLAINSYLKVLDKQPRNVEALGKLADCYRHLNRMDEAEKYYAQLMEMRNVDPIYYLQYGHTLRALGRYEEAKRYYYKYAEKYPVAGNHYAESCNFAIARQHDQPAAETTNEFVNTNTDDFGPAIFTEGRVVFASGRRDIRPDRRGAPRPALTLNNQLFISTRDANDFLRKPELLRQNFGSSFNEGPVAYSPDGKLVAITKNNFVDGTRQIPSSGFELSLHIGRVADNGDFTDIIPFPHNGSGYSTAFGSFSPDGQALYFASDRPDGFGGFDIYVSYRVGSGWSAPENLGSVVNTQGNELTPFFDGKNLYFASDWHFGFGGLDLFRAAQMPTGGWEAAENLGNGLNSPRDDYGFVFDPQFGIGYLVSNRLGGKGQLMVKVFDNLTKAPIAAAMIDFSSCGGPTSAQTDANGTYTLTLKGDFQCNPAIRKPGYITHHLVINTRTDQTRSYEVFLNKEGDVYTGQVIHAGTNTTLSDVRIRATNTATNQTLEALTDVSGKYTLALEPNSTYIVRYSKAGFKDVNRTVRTQNANSSHILETIYLPPSGTNIHEPTYTTPNEPVRPPGTPAPPPTTKPKSIVNVPPMGFAVQIAALSPDNIFLTGFEERVGNIGNVFAQTERGKAKIRVGIFEERETAENAKNKLRQMGFKDAFIVVQPTIGLEDKFIPAAGTSTTPAPPQPGTSMLANPSPYMIRLGAFKNPESFNRDPFVYIGIIDTYKSGPYTVVLLTGYESLEAAKRALRKVHAKGLKDAYIVEEIGGELRRVRG